MAPASGTTRRRGDRRPRRALVAARAFALCGLLLLPARAARASGWEIDGQSAAGSAMAGALTGLAPDASSIFYNPAGIAMRRGGDAMVGGSYLISTGYSVIGDVRTEQTRQGQLAPVVFASQHVLPQLALGVGLFSEVGGLVVWDAQGTQGTDSVDFPGRFLGSSFELQSITINPTVAFKANDWISVGVGLDVLVASTTMERRMLYGDTEGRAIFGGEARAVGYNVGVLAVLIPRRLSAGIAYRSAMSPGFTGQAWFEVPAELQPGLGNVPTSFGMVVPHRLAAGLAVHPLDGMTVSADVHASLWSDASELRLEFPGSALSPLVTELKWRDTLSLRAGFEYRVRRTSFVLRAGFGWDPSPAPTDTLDPLSPSTDRFLVGLGFGYTLTTSRLRGFGVAVGYLGALAGRRVSTNPDYPATVGQDEHQVTVSITYHWGGGIGAGVGAGTGCGPTGCDRCARCR